MAETYPGREQLPLDVGNLLSRMHFDASGVVQSCSDVWQGPLDESRDAEADALFHSTVLAMCCEKAIAALHGMAPVAHLRNDPEVNLSTKYEIEAGIRMISGLLPFSAEERRQLFGNSDGRREQWLRDSHKLDPNLIARWHEWLWERGTQEGQAGAASMFSMACGRLAAGVELALGWEHPR